MKHLLVHAQRNWFAAWPANNGLWSWGGRELLAGFTAGPFREQSGHNIDEPYLSLLARSTDQGETWTTEAPENFVGSGGVPEALLEPLSFTDPRFALRLEGNGYHASERPQGAFRVSRDRGRTWEGPFTLAPLLEHPELRGLELTARTEYLAETKESCLLFLSARGPGFAMDRAFCARLSEGGRRLSFVSWIVPPSDAFRAVMPAVVCLPSGRLVAVLRRRETKGDRCWLDAYAADAGGANWSFAGRVAETGSWNGNPPALACLRDGRLCCVYGNRDSRRMLARFSGDLGGTWEGERVLRDDFLPDSHGDPDLGYPRLAVREDGQVIALYYWATTAHPHQHIAATIWSP